MDDACRPHDSSLGNVGLATELHDLSEDIVADTAVDSGTALDQTTSDPACMTLAVMKSEPMQKVFTETKSM